MPAAPPLALLFLFLLLTLFFSAAQRIFAALQNECVHGNIVILGELRKLLKKRIGKADTPRGIRINSPFNSKYSHNLSSSFLWVRNNIVVITTILFLLF